MEITWTWISAQARFIWGSPWLASQRHLHKLDSLCLRHGFVAHSVADNVNYGAVRRHQYHCIEWVNSFFEVCRN